MSSNNETQGQNQTIICQYCKKETLADLNFCIECDAQIRCLECGTKTIAMKDYCLKCGKALVTKNGNGKAPNRYLRKVEQKGDNYKEHTEFSLSDNAVSEIAPFVINQTMPGYRIKNVPPLKRIDPPNTTIDVDAETISNEENEIGTQEKDSKTNTALPNSNNSSKFFKRDGDILVAIENDFKGKNWSEQQKNFLLVYTKAHKEIIGKAVPNKEHFKSAAEKLKIIDKNNFTNYIAKAIKEYMTQLSDGLELNTKGEKEAENIFKLMENDSVEGYEYWSRPTGNSTRQSRLSNDDKAKVASWASEKTELGKLDIRDIDLARDYALVAFWAVTINLKKENAIKWNEALLYLKKKFNTVTVTGDAFSKAVNSKENEKYFKKTTDGLFYLTPEGQKLVEGWVSGSIKVKKAEEDKK